MSLLADAEGIELQLGKTGHLQGLDVLSERDSEAE
jgi:hypothetical protein